MSREMLNITDPRIVDAILFEMGVELMDDMAKAGPRIAAQAAHRAATKLRLEKPVDAQRLDRFIRKHFDNTEHDHDQSDHAPRNAKRASERVNERRAKQVQDFVANHPQKSGIQFLLAEKAQELAASGNKGWADAVDEILDPDNPESTFLLGQKLLDESPELALKTILANEREDIGGEARRMEMARDPKRMKDAKFRFNSPNETDQAQAFVNTGDLAVALADLNLLYEGKDKREQAKVVKAWADEIANVARHDTQVGRSVEAMSVLANTYGTDEQGRKAALLRDIVELIGEERTDGVIRRTMGTFGSSGRFTDEDYGRLGSTAFLYDDSITASQRRNMIGAWMKDRSKGRSSFINRLAENNPKFRDPGIGFVINDDGTIDYGYRGSTKGGDDLMPFNLRGLLGMEDKHVIRSRNMGSITTSDVFWSMVASPKSITVVSPNDELTLHYGAGLRDSLWQRMKFYKQFKNYEKAVEKSGMAMSEGNTRHVLELMKGDFPRMFDFDKSQTFTTSRGYGSIAEQQNKALKDLESALRTLSDEDLVDVAEIKRRAEPKNASERMIFERMTPDEQDAWRQDRYKEAMEEVFLDAMLPDHMKGLMTNINQSVARSYISQHGQGLTQTAGFKKPDPHS